MAIRLTHGGKEAEKTVLDHIGRVVFEGDQLTFPDRKSPAEKLTGKFILEPGARMMLMVPDARIGRDPVSEPYHYEFVDEDELG